jgi:hypothetical protein
MAAAIRLACLLPLDSVLGVLLFTPNTASATIASAKETTCFHGGAACKASQIMSAPACMCVTLPSPTSALVGLSNLTSPLAFASNKSMTGSFSFCSMIYKDAGMSSFVSAPVTCRPSNTAMPRFNSAIAPVHHPKKQLQTSWCCVPCTTCKVRE